MQSKIVLPAPGQLLRYTGLTGSSDTLLLTKLIQSLATPRAVAIIAANALDAQRLFEEIPFFLPEAKIYLLPDWETLPYDTFSPHYDLISERLATLYQVMNAAYDILIVPATTALYRICPKAFLAAHTFFIKQGSTLDLPHFRNQMTLAGYSHVNQVLSPGEYSVRGGLVDLFPMGSALPYRIDLFDDEIETIRTFDADTQRSIYPVSEIRLLPAREFPLDETGRSQFRVNFREKFEGDPSRSKIYKEISKGSTPAGIEYYLPLFFEQTATIFDYLPQDSLICLHQDVYTATDQFWRDTQSRYQLLRGDIDRPLLPPVDLFLTADNFFGHLKSYARIQITSQQLDQSDEMLAQSLPSVRVDRHAANPLEKLAGFISAFNSTGGRILLIAESIGRREIIYEYLQDQRLIPWDLPKLC